MYNYAFTPEDIQDDFEQVTPPASNEAPVADAGADQGFDCVVGSADVTLDGSASSDPDGDALSYSWSDGSSVVSTDASFTTSQGAGTHTFTLTVSDGEASSSASVTVTVELDETAPVIAAVEDITTANDPGVCGAEVTFALSAVDACGGEVTITSDPASGSFFAVGETEVTVTASDAAGNTSESTFTVTVEDTEAPSLVANGEPITLWPPNHQYVAFDVTDFVVSVDDNCTDLEAAGVLISHVTSDEVEDARGGGDGNTDNDIYFDGTTLNLRAERQGSGNGRVYTVHLAIEDEHGNLSTATAQVHVPKSRNRVAVDDGAVYEVFGPALGRLNGAAGEELATALIPEGYELSQNYPNPFNPSTTISYALPEAGNVTLVVYDLRGSQVAELANGWQSAGIHRANFNASNLAAGTYLYVLTVDGERMVRRMLLIK